MPPAVMEKGNRMRHIVRIRQMLQRWRKKAQSTAARTPSDVPAGHVAIYVKRRRFIVRATYLNHPIFKRLLVQAEEEYGFTNQGPLTIPCDELVFEEILRFVSQQSDSSSQSLSLEEFQRCCHVDLKENRSLLVESRPLLRGFGDESVF